LAISIPGSPGFVPNIIFDLFECSFSRRIDIAVTGSVNNYIGQYRLFA
jgi:hypothetical protein